MEPSVPPTASISTTRPSAFLKLRTACRRKLRRSVQTLDQTYIYGYVPLLHSIVFLFEMAAVAQIVRRYDHYFDSRPVLTMMVTNSVLNGIADTVAQTVTAMRRKAVQPPVEDMDSKSKLAYELEELPHHSKKLASEEFNNPARPPPFDFERLIRFASWGFVVAPFQFKWLQLLQHWFPLTSTSATVPALKRVAADQLLFAPVGLAAFFTYMTYAEGGDMNAVKKRLSHVYVPTLKANFILWPAVQLLNFRVMPLQFQLPFSSTVGIAWGVYLSLTNSSDA